MSGCGVQHTYERERGRVLEPRYKRELGKGEEEVLNSIRANKARKLGSGLNRTEGKAKGKSVDRGHIFG